MIRPEDPFVNAGAFDGGGEGGRDEKVVDSPSDVAGSSAGAVGPPGVEAALAGMAFAENVDETLI